MAASQDETWKIPSRAESCARCEVALAPGDRVVSTLHLDAAGPRREDLCATCGEAVESVEAPIFWRWRRPPADAPQLVVDYTLLREIFTHLLSRPEEHYRRLSYLVALVLLRKRLLRLVGFESRKGGEVMVVSRGAGQPSIDVPAPHLSADELLATREQLTRLLQSDIPDDLALPHDLGAERATADD